MNDALALSHIPRWTIVRNSPGQSVADHTYRVSIIAMELYSRLNLSAIDSDYHLSAILSCALTHDVDEAVTGDIPTSYKSAGYPLKPLIIPLPPTCRFSYREYSLVKLADQIEAVTYIREHGRGVHARAVAQWLYERLKTWYRKECRVPEATWEVVEQMIVEILAEDGRTPTREPKLEPEDASTIQFEYSSIVTSEPK